MNSSTTSGSLNDITVTVVIPVFNSQETLKETLNSLVGQSFTSWECLLVDDGSSDGSLALIENQIERDGRFRFLSRDPERAKGGSSCRNQGIQHARGRYLVFLDSDDVIRPRCLADRVAAMKASEDHDFLVFQGATFETDPGHPIKFWNVAGPDPDADRIAYLDPPWSITGPIWKTEFLRKHQLEFRPVVMLQDVYFHLDVMALHPRYEVFFGRCDYLVRVGQNTSLSRSWKEIDAKEEGKFAYLDYLLELEGRKLIRKESIAGVVCEFIRLFIVRNDRDRTKRMIKRTRETQLSSGLERFGYRIFELLYQLKSHRIPPLYNWLTKKLFRRWPDILLVTVDYHD